MKNTKKLLSLLLVIAMIFALAVPAFAEGETPSMAGKTVIVHSNDVHGAIAGYANIAALAAEYESQGAKVIVADAGDFSQGKVEVSSNKGLNAVKMMNAAGYDIATLGNHEFDYGYAQLKENLKEATFSTICCNILDENGKPAFEGSKVFDIDGLKVGFIGVNTPESQTKANPALIKGLTWLAGADMVKAVQAEADKLKADGTDVIVVLSHLGVDSESEPNRSTACGQDSPALTSSSTATLTALWKRAIITSPSSPPAPHLKTSALSLSTMPPRRSKRTCSSK